MFGIYLSPTAELSKTAQLCSQIRKKIEKGELSSGTRLPPTRKLAQELGIARNVVIDAYEQLVAEGYLIGHAGSGTYVADGILSFTSSGVQPEVTVEASEPQGESKELREQQEDMIEFGIGTPDLESFPDTLWSKYLKAAVVESSRALFDYGDSRGEEELRVEICAYLYRTRGMRCHPEQVMITSGSSEGISLIATALRAQYHSIYLEDPTIEFTYHIFKQNQYQIAPVDVDESGMELHELDDFADRHLLLLTPSHQFPTGGILPIQRRQQAVRMVERADSYIIEDDYDGDFRLKGIPIPPIYSLSPERVLYVGTFSKTLAPGLRLGFIVLPQHLIKRFAQLREELNLRTPTVPQIALARFMRDGRLDRHIHKMKKLYRQRRTLLISALKQHFGKRARIIGDEAGMHMRVEFPEGPFLDDWQESIAYGVKVHSVEEYSLVKGKHLHQIVLGYGNVQEHDIQKGIERLYQFYVDKAQ